MTYKGVVFDLDGTLVNTIEDIADSMNEILTRYNKNTFKYSEYKKLVGRGFDNLIIDTFEDNISQYELTKIREELDLEYSKRFLNKSKPYKNILNLLYDLRSRGILLGINTNKKEEYAIEIINKLFCDIDFVKIIGQSSKFKIKPNPEGVLSIIEKMKLSRSKILYVGDSDIDIYTGKNANIKTVGVSWGFRGSQELLDSGADYIIDDPLELTDIIEQ